MVFFDDLETRNDDQRSAQNTALLKGILKSASDLAGYKETLSFDRISNFTTCLLYTSPSPRDLSTSRMPSSA